MKTGRELHIFRVPHAYLSSTLMSLEKGKKLVFGSSDGIIRIWDVGTGQEILTFREKNQEKIDKLMFLEEGKKVAFLNEKGIIHIWDMKTGKKLQTFGKDGENINSLILLERGKKLASGNQDGSIHIWEIKTGKILQTLRGHPTKIHNLIMLPGEEKLVSRSGDGVIQIWEIKTGKRLQIFGRENEHFDILDGSFILLEGGEIEHFDILDGSFILLEGGEKLASIEERYRTTFTSEDVIHIWEIKTGKKLHTFPLERDSKDKLWMLLEKEKKLLAISRSIRTWDVETGQEFPRIDYAYPPMVLNMGKGNKLACMSDKNIQIWDLETGQILYKFTGHTENNRPLGMLCAGTEDNHPLEMFCAGDIEDNRLPRMMGSLLLLKNRRKIISASTDKTIRIWKTEVGLEYLNIEDCKNLQTLRLKSTSLKTFLVKNNPLLKKVDLETHYFPQLEFKNCPQLDTNQVFNQVWNQVLINGHCDIFNTVLTPFLCSSLVPLITPDIQTRLFDLLERSKEKFYLASAAANAITLLNLAHVSFAGKDLRGIRIPGAYLEGANFINADLRESDLTGINLTKATLTFTRLDNARMGEVELEKGRGLKTSTGPISSIRHLIVLQDRENLASISYEFSDYPLIQIWNAKTGQELHRIKAPKESIQSLISLEGGKKLASASNQTIRIWEVETGKMLKTFSANIKLSSRLIAVGDEKNLALVNEDGISILNVETGLEIDIFREDKGWIENLVVCGTMLAWINRGKVHLWDVERRKELKTISFTSTVTALILLDRGKKLALAGDSTIQVWEVETRRELKALSRSHPTTEVVALIPLDTGKKLAAVSRKGPIEVWEIETGHKLKDLSIISTGNALISLDEGKKLVSINKMDSKITIWEFETGKQLFSIPLSYPFSTCSVQEPNLLYIGGKEGGISCWEILEDHALLLWQTDPVSLICSHVDISNVKNLSKENQQFMLQHGATKKG